VAALLVALVSVVAAFIWQATTVHFNYGGNWTGLFWTGDARPVPPELAANTYVFKSGTGYDGQFYRYVAHDPWFQKGLWKYHDAARWRSWRILVPALAWLVAGGQSRYIDAAYMAVILLFVGLGTYWLGRYAASYGRHPAWGLGFLLLPATLISIDRLTIDIALAALCAGFVWYSRRESTVGLYAVLVLAGLARETGLLLVAAACLYELWNRRWRRAALFATAALPVLVWLRIVTVQTAHPHRLIRGYYLGGLAAPWFFQYPLVGIIMALFRAEPYPVKPPLLQVVQAVDVLALCGFLFALALAVWGLWRRRLDREQWVALCFVALALVLSVPGYWRHVYSYGRPLSPLLFVVGLRAFAGARWWVLVPILLMDVRMAVQMSPQFLGILRGLL
jgi:hypothetical protein